LKLDSTDSSAPQEGLDRLAGAVAAGLPSLDGAQSPQTRDLVTTLSARGVDMNTWWVMTPMEWTCSACGRSKRDIARLNQKGELMCHLVEHHDHVQDLLEKRFQEISSTQDVVVANGGAKRFALRAAPMVSAYENTVICSDCNTADPDAKRGVGADKNFSFSAAEIRKFVRARPNAPHKDLDLPTAQMIWEGHRSNFQLRLKIIDRIAQIAATNEHWFQESARGSSPRLIETMGRHIVSGYVNTTHEAILHLSGKRRSNLTATPATWRTRQYPPCKCPPSDKEVEHMAKVECEKVWNSVPDQWSCEACHRSKREVVRPSKQLPWSFNVAHRRLCDPALPGSTQKYWLCEDCCWVARELGREAARIANASDNSYSMHVTLEELASIIEPRPHAMHVILNDLAELIVHTVVDRLSEDKGASQE
jgi:rubredoxin